MVRVGTGTPTSKKNFSWPAGEQMHISRATFVEVFRNWCGAFAGMFNGFASLHHYLCATEGCLDFAFEDGERLLEIVPVRRRAASGRNMHIDQAESACSIVARKKNCICISYQADVANIFARVGSHAGEFSAQVVGRKSRCWQGRNGWFIGHAFTPFVDVL